MLKNSPLFNPRLYWGSSHRAALGALALLALFCLGHLAQRNMADNELNYLAVARQYVNPAWIPKDWYLNQPIGHQALFSIIFGRLAEAWGFLATSIIGRFLGYSLIASALVCLGRRLGLVLPLILLAVSMFLVRQHAIAGEWMIGGIEEKVFAYGLILWAIERMFNKSYRSMAFLLGLATSFHVLVGGYAALTVLGWIILRWKRRLPDTRDIILSISFYLAGSLFAIEPILRQVASQPVPTSSLQPSYIYVFLRNPHHLNPFRWLSWSWLYWLYLCLLVTTLLISFGVLWRSRPAEGLSEAHKSRSGLFEFTLISLIPFVLGLAIAPFDRQGHLLKFYLFRFGDVMLPLNTYLLTACAVQHLLIEKPYLTDRAKKRLLLTCILILSVIYLNQAYSFAKDLSALRQFPGQHQGVDPDQKELFDWVKRNTPKNSTIVSSPTLPHFSWMSERATVAQFKMVPIDSAAIIEWYQRLQDLSGNNSPWRDAGFTAVARLARDYLRLTTVQVESLMAKYEADYFLTTVEQNLELPIAYRNESYVLYRQRKS